MNSALKIICFTLVTLFSYVSSGLGQDTVQVPKKATKPKPLFFVDTKQVKEFALSYANADDIALVQALPLDKALEIHGNKAKNGVVYVFTTKYCTEQYKRGFSDRSSEYKKVLKDEGGSDERIQYIIDGKLLKEKFQDHLYMIRNNPRYFLKIIEKEGLQLYGVTDKLFGFVITKRAS
jgi:hypothetical protein